MFVNVTLLFLKSVDQIPKQVQNVVFGLKWLNTPHFPDCEYEVADFNFIL